MTLLKTVLAPLPLASALVAMSLAATPARAQMMGVQIECKPLAAWRQTLTSDKWKEQPFALGRAGNDQSAARMELWVNGETRTWTILLLPRPDVACQMLSGGGFQPAAAKAPGEES